MTHSEIKNRIMVIKIIMEALNQKMIFINIIPDLILKKLMSISEKNKKRRKRDKRTSSVKGLKITIKMASSAKRMSLGTVATPKMRKNSSKNGMVSKINKVIIGRKVKNSSISKLNLLQILTTKRIMTMNLFLTNSSLADSNRRRRKYIKNMNPRRILISTQRIEALTKDLIFSEVNHGRIISD